MWDSIFEMGDNNFSRRRPGTDPAVKVVLTGVLGQFTARAVLKTRFFRGFKLSRKPVSQAEASPQQVESLAAVVRILT